MAGAGLIAIKRRIKAITNTKKITKAMGLIATSKLKKARGKLDVNNSYYNNLKNILDEILSDSITFRDEKNIYIDGNKCNKKLYIVLTSDMGLCGGFNAGIANLTSEMLEKEENPLLMVAGKRGKVYFKRLGIKFESEDVEVPDVPTLLETKGIVSHALNYYNSGEVGEIYVVYSRFFSAIKRYPIVEKILPLEASKEEDNKIDTTYLKLEPDFDNFIEYLVPKWLEAKLLNAMFNSKTSEHGSRMEAMQGATKNANDIIDQLNLKYNRVRQSAITQEISEIVGGAEAQK